MPISFAEASILTQNKLVKGIQQEMISESPFMGRLPFEDVEGNAYTYVREDTTSMGSVAWAGAYEELVSSHATYTLMTASLYRLYGQADVDNLIQAAQSNGAADQMAAQIKIKSRLMAKEFENRIIYGSSSTEGMIGLQATQLLTTTQQVHAAANGVTTSSAGVLTIHNLNVLCDMIRGGPPSFLLMTRNIKRRLTEYLMTVGSYQTERNAYGDQWEVWQGIPLLRCDSLLQTELMDGGTPARFSAPTGGNSSSVIAVRISNADGFHGIQNGGIKTEYWDKLEGKDARRTRMMWYLGCALKSTKALAVMDGISDVAVTA
jgi:hypothetical protein